MVDGLSWSWVARDFNVQGNDDFTTRHAAAIDHGQTDL
jgi:hypothetical protein